MQEGTADFSQRGVLGLTKKLASSTYIVFAIQENQQSIRLKDASKELLPIIYQSSPSLLKGWCECCYVSPCKAMNLATVKFLFVSTLTDIITVDGNYQLEKLKDVIVIMLIFTVSYSHSCSQHDHVRTYMQVSWESMHLS